MKRLEGPDRTAEQRKFLMTAFSIRCIFSALDNQLRAKTIGSIAFSRGKIRV
jgi:hypothetical protein